MWTPLFMLNKEPLCREIKCIIERLNEYLDAIEQDDSERLKQLLRDGRILKENTKTIYTR